MHERNAWEVYYRCRVCRHVFSSRSQLQEHRSCCGSDLKGKSSASGVVQKGMVEKRVETRWVDGVGPFVLTWDQREL